MKITLERLKAHKAFTDNLRFDLTPEILCKPRYVKPGSSDEQTLDETKGFMFYIDYMKDISPSLMLFKTYHMRTRTIGAVEEIPQELLKEAVSLPGAKEICGMYPISPALESWLRERLGMDA